MRDYAKVAATFWTGETGKKIRVLGRDSQVIAFYLITCPNSNWIGLYYLPLPTLYHEVGITKEGASKALRSLEEIDFAYYDFDTEVVWVPGAAKYQIGESLKPGDKRILGIIKDLQTFGKTPFARDFLTRYSGLYHLYSTDLPDHPDKALRRPSQAPPKPVTETETETGAVAQGLCERPREPSNGSKNHFAEVWAKYPAHRRGSETVAFDAWARLNPCVSLQAVIMRAILRLKDSEEWCRDGGRYVPGFAKFIDSKGWDAADDLPEEVKPDAPGSDPRPPKGCKWRRDNDGELVHPLEAIPA